MACSVHAKFIVSEASMTNNKHIHVLLFAAVIALIGGGAFLGSYPSYLLGLVIVV